MTNQCEIIDLRDMFNAKKCVNGIIRDAAILHEQYVQQYDMAPSKRLHDMAQFYGAVLAEYEA